MTTNYQKHFGDPLRVAETLSDAGICWGTLTGEIGCGEPCDGCPLHDVAVRYEDGEEERLCYCGRVEDWLNWLESEANE